MGICSGREVAGAERCVRKQGLVLAGGVYIQRVHCFCGTGYLSCGATTWAGRTFLSVIVVS